MDNKKIVVGMIDTDRPPLFMTGPNGQPEGFTVRLAEDMAKELGVKLEINRTAKNYEDVVELVAKKEIDLGMSALSTILPWAKMVYFSHPYLILHYAMLVNRVQLLAQGKNFSLQDIRAASVTIGVMRESAYAHIARKTFPHAVLEEFDSFDDMITAVTEGKVFAVLNNDLFLKRYIKLNPASAFRLEVQVLEEMENPVAIAIHPDSPHLLSWINLYLSTKALPLNADALLKDVLPANLP